MAEVERVLGTGAQHLSATWANRALEKAPETASLVIPEKATEVVETIDLDVTPLEGDKEVED